MSDTNERPVVGRIEQLTEMKGSPSSILDQIRGGVKAGEIHVFAASHTPNRDAMETHVTSDHIHPFPRMPNPTEQDLQEPVFNAIWEMIKTWDINVPLYYKGYCGANGSHAKLIFDAIFSKIAKVEKLATEDDAEEGQTEDFDELWTRIKYEILSESTELVLYVEKDDFPLKGALVEVGIAFVEIPIHIILHPDIRLTGRTMRPLGSWCLHNSVVFHQDLLAYQTDTQAPIIHWIDTETERHLITSA